MEGKGGGDEVYTDLIISTIVDFYFFKLVMFLVYTDLIISTIVDRKSPVIFSAEEVYKDLIISTIVDEIRLRYYCTGL